MTGKYALTFDLLSPLLALKDDDDDRRPHLPPIVKPSDCGNATSADGNVDATTDAAKMDWVPRNKFGTTLSSSSVVWIGCPANDRHPCLRLCWHATAVVRQWKR